MCEVILFLTTRVSKQFSIAIDKDGEAYALSELLVVVVIICLQTTSSHAIAFASLSVWFINWFDL